VWGRMNGLSLLIKKIICFHDVENLRRLPSIN